MKDERTMITPLLVEKLREKFPEVLLGESRADGRVLDLSRLSPEQIETLKMDLLFFHGHPTLPVENVFNTLETYEVKNDSHEKALTWANRILALEDHSRTAGLYLYGPSGIGKTHLAVSLGKEFEKRGLETFFAQGGDNPLYRLSIASQGSDLLSRYQAWVIDDLNSPYGTDMGAFKNIVMHAHNRGGGRIFVTSNVSLSYLVENGFVTDINQKKRYVDRIKGMFQVVELDGLSHRESKAWHAES